MKKQQEKQYRPLNELNLIDNFLFGSIISDPEDGEEFAASILKIVTGKCFKNLKVVPQKSFYGADVKYHGARMDVYIEDDPDGEVATVYDVEPEKNDKKNDVKAIPKRTRFYHAKLSSLCLGSGQSYENLKNVIVIMITPFDPFGEDRMMYTIKNRCVEEPDLPYEDGATTIFLYTKGKKGIPSQEMQEFLKYFENTKQNNAVNTDLQRIDEMVRKTKQNAEVGVRYMQMMEDERVLIQRGIEEGMKEGIKQGIALESKKTKKAEQENKKLKELLKQNNIPIPD